MPEMAQPGTRRPHGGETVITVVAGGAIPMQAEERRPDYKRALSPRRTG